MRDLLIKDEEMIPVNLAELAHADRAWRDYLVGDIIELSGATWLAQEKDQWVRGDDNLLKLETYYEWNGRVFAVCYLNDTDAQVRECIYEKKSLDRLKVSA